MNKREHFECWLKTRYPSLPRDYNAKGDYYNYSFADLAYRAWLASPKTRPTEPNKISKEQLAAMKGDTTEIVDHLRGIYTGIADAYPVNPLMLKAADEIERLRDAVGGVLPIIRQAIFAKSTSEFDQNELMEAAINLRAVIGKK